MKVVENEQTSAVAMPEEYLYPMRDIGYGLMSGVIDVNPDWARRALESSLGNRNLNKAKIETFSKQMIDGRWNLNGETIVFDSGNHLRDGHGRCTAIIKSGCSVPMIVIRGIELTAWCTIDKGTGRSYQNSLQMMGVSNYALRSTITRNLYYYCMYGAFNGASTDEKNFDECASRFEQFINMAVWLDADTRWQAFLYHSRLCALAVVFYATDPIAAAQFFERLTCGDTPGSTISKLRDILMIEKSRGTKRMSICHIAAYMIKAFNADRRGQTLNRFSWDEGSGLPVIDGFVNPYKKITSTDAN